MNRKKDSPFAGLFYLYFDIYIINGFKLFRGSWIYSIACENDYQL